MAARQRAAARPWYLDGLTAFAFFVMAYTLGRATRGLPILAFFLFAGSAGVGWYFARAAWRGLILARDG